jgi:hypothetical protein
MTVEEALGTLIRMANPYTDGKPGSIRIDAPLHPPTVAVGAEPSVDPAQVHVEEDNYQGQWIFRGQTETIKKGLRITYRYPKKDNSGNFLYYVTEHLLVGYAGGNGP